MVSAILRPSPRPACHNSGFLFQVHNILLHLDLYLWGICGSWDLLPLIPVLRIIILDAAEFQWGKVCILFIDRYYPYTRSHGLTAIFNFCKKQFKLLFDPAFQQKINHEFSKGPDLFQWAVKMLNLQVLPNCLSSIGTLLLILYRKMTTWPQ